MQSTASVGGTEWPGLPPDGRTCVPDDSRRRDPAAACARARPRSSTVSRFAIVRPSPSAVSSSTARRRGTSRATAKSPRSPGDRSRSPPAEVPRSAPTFVSGSEQRSVNLKTFGLCHRHLPPGPWPPPLVGGAAHEVGGRQAQARRVALGAMVRVGRNQAPEPVVRPNLDPEVAGLGNVFSDRTYTPFLSGRDIDEATTGTWRAHLP